MSTPTKPPEAAPLPDRADFDEAMYLNRHQDVRRAVEQREFASGWDHFARQGAGEGRAWYRPARLVGLDFGAIFAAWRAR
ncbi:hypothetical protein EDC65_3309 [Stella humosa]|uniref:Uncharacterized protein n=1 Tax=Stella humosa TaxID=94 RepID=A0A3N1L3H8_9PROT|nr:hypothetical protein [Stella humosa]ROP83965.1 hypothetical protein EDC65_3309 [Stella humosa]BBK33473.1 hypothetical protein STHU_41070 [Stella humosa]